MKRHGGSRTMAAEDHDASASTRHMAAERYLLDEMTEMESTNSKSTSSIATTARRKCGSVSRSVRRCARSRLGTRGTAIHTARTSNVVEFNKRPAWRRPSTVIPWAVAATLAMTAGYQSLVTVPGLRHAISPQSISPVMLRERDARAGAGRDGRAGSALRHPWSRRDGCVDASDVTYDLLDAAGNTILSGRTPLPPSGAPLYLLIPADELVRPGRYTLIVRDPASPARRLASTPSTHN